MTPSILFISLLFLGISMLVSGVLKSKFNRYGKIPLASGLSGAEVAAKMLHDNMIYDVKITSVNGFMTDHYNPANKTINLSPEVYNGTSIAAAAVAAHECGHAVQHATAYSWLTMRKAGARGSVQLGYSAVDPAGRRTDDQRVSPVVACRHRSFRCYHIVFGDHAAC